MFQTESAISFRLEVLRHRVFREDTETEDTVLEP